MIRHFAYSYHIWPALSQSARCLQKAGRAPSELCFSPVHQVSRPKSGSPSDHHELSASQENTAHFILQNLVKIHRLAIFILVGISNRREIGTEEKSTIYEVGTRGTGNCEGILWTRSIRTTFKFLVTGKGCG